jgi:hypothetical protein
MTIHHISTACRRLLANFIVAVAVLCISPQVSALPTPTMNEGEMMGMADVVAEGEVSSVTLLRRWIGDRPGYDLGHERGLATTWTCVKPRRVQAIWKTSSAI